MKYHITKGQTLMELLIASAVIATGLFAAAAIVFSNLQLSDRDADEVTAVNLSREGIELAKERRDSNWLAGDAFDEGLHAGGNDYTAVPEWDGTLSSGSVSFDFTPNAMDSANAAVMQSEQPDTPGFFTQVDPAGLPTPWRRLLTFHPICESAGGLTYKDDGENCGTDQKIGVRIRSHVQWQRKSQTFDRVMYEDVFDWR